jgi:ABC-type uncharacterized transport system permease subunit
MNFFRSLLKPVASVILGLSLGLLISSLAGEDPWYVLEVLVKGAFGSRYDFGMTLFYTTSLAFTGLAVAIPFQAGLFNIGAEGQLTLGALAAAAVGICFPNLAWPLAPVAAVLAAFSAGALWGAIPGYLRAKRGSHEVINTIMLNFIAAGLSSWVTLYLLRNTQSQNPETKAVGAGYLISHLAFFGDAPTSTAIFLVLFVAFVVWVLLWKTVWGFELRSVGQSEKAARAAGVNDAKVRILAMALGGGIAGLVAVPEILGNSTRFKMGFSPDYGFIGIAVALLGRGRPLGVLAAALLFGALHKGTADLDLETEHITRDFSMILEALVILAISAEGIWKLGRKK